jgi:hypothetical protein
VSRPSKGQLIAGRPSVPQDGTCCPLGGQLIRWSLGGTAAIELAARRSTRRSQLCVVQGVACCPLGGRLIGARSSRRVCWAAVSRPLDGRLVGVNSASPKTGRTGRSTRRSRRPSRFVGCGVSAIRWSTRPAPPQAATTRPLNGRLGVAAAACRPPAVSSAGSACAVRWAVNSLGGHSAAQRRSGWPLDGRLVGDACGVVWGWGRGWSGGRREVELGRGWSTRQAGHCASSVGRVARLVACRRWLGGIGWCGVVRWVVESIGGVSSVEWAGRPARHRSTGPRGRSRRAVRSGRRSDYCGHTLRPRSLGWCQARCRPPRPLTRRRQVRRAAVGAGGRWCSRSRCRSSSWWS